MLKDKEFVEAVQAKKAEIMAASAKELETMTDAEKEAFAMKVTAKAKAEVKQTEKDEALKMVLDFCKDVGASDTDLQEAVTLLTKAPRAPKIPGEKAVSSGPRASRFTMLDELFPEVGAEVHEDEIYKRYKVGRKEVYWTIADAIKGAKDKDTRKWVSFDPASGLYTLLAIQATPPEGWNGYVPLDERKTL
jgi:hypothetical protein